MPTSPCSLLRSDASQNCGQTLGFATQQWDQPAAGLAQECPAIGTHAPCPPQEGCEHVSGFIARTQQRLDEQHVRDELALLVIGTDADACEQRWRRVRRMILD